MLVVVGYLAVTYFLFGVILCESLSEQLAVDILNIPSSIRKETDRPFAFCSLISDGHL